MSKLTTTLLWPFLAPDVRLRLRHQRLDAEAPKRAGWALQIPEVKVTRVKAVDGALDGTGGGPGSRRGMRLTPVAPSPWKQQQTMVGTRPIDRWLRSGAMEWDGRRVTIAGSLRTGTWIPREGGLIPDFDAAEVARAGRRPFGTGECERHLAAIATVGLAGRHLKRIVFLDAEARELGWIPAPYFAQDDVIRFAQAAGIAYRSYAFTFAGYSSTRLSPEKLCEALFTRSARRVKLMGDGASDESDWLSDPTRSRGY
ncbi:hypothetical protein Caci_2004 [Catenulispora acidiphila DSM 44928]|uniref:Uncharacterized protein n=1 Tax=Catenulispora acidiphila (strain DSM 44928 / JCM 14897 / NBRC 102108 / NRRL B-24433 / ID139908) TaxID=479433 RepID=C7QFU7_CATAD|nr:hypothetical protein [Catenulispora acidiphila]ACU70924.1 hypothetical protein Caci_2004 [Catenulispora acidiphila DSM 44928]